MGLPFFNENISKEIVKEKLREINKDTEFRDERKVYERKVAEYETKNDYDK